MKKVRIDFPAPIKPDVHRLKDPQFQKLAAIPSESAWLDTFNSKQSRRAYESDVTQFKKFAGINQPEEFRQITRSLVDAWRQELERHQLARSSVRRKLAALASLFDFFCDRDAVSHNPVDGVPRPKEAVRESKTEALSDDDVRWLLTKPDSDTLKGKRDLAILSTMLFLGLRRKEVSKLRVKDLQLNLGVRQLEIRRTRGRTRRITLHPHTSEALHAYLMSTGHYADKNGAMFRALYRSTRDGSDRGLSTDGIYKIVCSYSGNPSESDTPRQGPHALRVTAATNALNNNASMTEVQEWLGHAAITSTRAYKLDRRRIGMKDSPSLKVSY